MKRREFIQGVSLAGAALALAGPAQGAEPQAPTAEAPKAAKPSIRDIGWAWEGQGIDPQVPPSIYGLGQGARYFGLSRVNYLFHPNDVHALRLLQDYDEVTCDISKWGWEWNEDGRPACKPKSDPVTVRTEGENVARLAKDFPNVTGVYCDDLLGLMTRFNYGPDEFGAIRSAIRDLNPGLNLWTVVYTHEFEKADFWTAMRPHIDVVTLWIWKSEDIVRMPEYVDQCLALFPDKPVVMGVYLRDYTKVAPVPVDLVKSQMEGIADLVEKGKLSGYSILAAVLIDGHRSQADAVRDFITAHSG
ncbi:MAG: twin-arginine translocation signal domain-containing protein [Candidatus Hydrogenedentes bacterium]|nr:twin-arginine translocation signal domain-containing protein [Candidatus Hydrogenedentota bacterium]